MTAAAKALVPMASVRSVARSIEFYRKLGFEVGNTHAPEGATEPVWAWLRTPGAAQLMLSRADDPVDPKRQGVLFYVYCDDVLAFRKRLMESGIECGAVTTPFYNPKGEFPVTDPDGYALLITHT